MTDKRFAVFILSHGRPDNVLTLRSLLRSGYTGDWYIVVDDMDATADQYRERYGSERVIMFDKRAVAETFDTADLSTDLRAVVFARNVAFDLARERGYRYFVQMDDDYPHYEHRYDDEAGHHWCFVRDMDAVFGALTDFLESSGVSAVALGQNGDLLGGHLGSRWQQRVARKVMNAIICRTADSWRFLGRVNEDVNTYTTLGTRGHVFLSIMDVVLQQKDTQSQAGGMTDLYQNEGTYQKSMYPVLMCPSGVRVTAMGETRPRIHHRVQWNNVAPKILPEQYRKGPRHGEQ